MPEHEPPRTERLALYMRERAAEKATHDEAVCVVTEWNALRPPTTERSVVGSSNRLHGAPDAALFTRNGPQACRESSGEICSRISGKSARALVRLVDQPHGLRPVLHADRRRRASLPVVERISHCDEIGSNDVGAGERLVPISGSEL